MMDEEVDVTVSARDTEVAIKALQKGCKDPKYLGPEIIFEKGSPLKAGVLCACRCCSY